jgi:hypothetical protein
MSAEHRRDPGRFYQEAQNRPTKHPWTEEEKVALRNVLDTLERLVKDPATTKEQMLNALSYHIKP